MEDLQLVDGSLEWMEVESIRGALLSDAQWRAVREASQFHGRHGRFERFLLSFHIQSDRFSRSIAIHDRRDVVPLSIAQIHASRPEAAREGSPVSELEH